MLALAGQVNRRTRDLKIYVPPIVNEDYVVFLFGICENLIVVSDVRVSRAVEDGYVQP